MDTLIFSQPAIFRLQQLSLHLYRRTGVRHKLSTPEGIASLLKDSRQTQAGDIKDCYAAFIQELDEAQIDALAARGISLMPVLQPRSAAARQMY